MWFDLDEAIRFRVQSVKFHPVPSRMDMQVPRSMLSHSVPSVQ